MSSRSIEIAGDLLAREIGLRLDSAILARLARVLESRAKACGDSLDHYVVRLGSQPDLFQNVLNDVTVPKTSFFRDRQQFDFVARNILPNLVSPVTVWSAGCATGQEPYSLAMTLAQSGIKHWMVLATDISTLALERTSAAVYADNEMECLTQKERVRFFRRVQDGWEVAGPLRDRVVVCKQNLAADIHLPGCGECSIVFCRNTLIYFRPEALVPVLERIDHCMAPGGYLFLGSSEMLWDPPGHLELVRSDGVPVYRKRGGALAQDTSTLQRLALPVDSVDSADSVKDTASADNHLTAGDFAMSSEDYVAAVVSFRKAAYLDADNVLAHLQLGLAFEGNGDHAGAQRAFRAALAALGRSDIPSAEPFFEGYSSEDLANFLRAKLAARPGPEAGPQVSSWDAE